MSIVRLYSIYRREPDRFSGLWQLSITDFYCDICFTALLLAAGRAIAPNDFVPVGIVVALLLGVAFLFSMLVAARKGYKRSLVKWIYALGMLLRSLGYMAVFVMIIVMPVILMIGGPRLVVEFVSGIVLADYRDWFAVVIRFGLICLPVGIGICKFVERVVTGSGPHPPESQPQKQNEIA
jgi:hypothetical protein